MNKLRNFLLKKLAPKNGVTVCIPASALLDDEQYGRRYVQLDESLRLYFEDGKYVGFSTQEPYIGKKKEDVRS